MLGRLFALYCVTFLADTGKINPALWTDRAGDTAPFILAGTASHLVSGLEVEVGKGGKNRAKETEREKGTQATHAAITHVYL